MAGGILQAKGNLLASKGAALSSLAESLKGSGGIGGGLNFNLGGGGGKSHVTIFYVTFSYLYV